MQLLDIYNMPIFKAIGLSIVHSFWQALIILLVLKMALVFMNKKNSALRYYTCILLMLVLVTTSVFTAVNEFSKAVQANDSAVSSQATVTSQSVNELNSAQIVSLSSEFERPLIFSNLVIMLSPYLALIWIAGFLFFIAKFVQASVYLTALRKLPGDGHDISEGVLNELVTKMGIGRPVRLIITKNVLEPITFGFLRPVILLPFGYAMGVPVEEVQMILAHELSHIRRSDYLFNLFQSILDAVYFYNPFFRSISNTIRNEREYCCDDMASSICGNKETMAIALTNLKYLTTHPQLSLSASPVRSSFHERIYRLILPVSYPRFSSGIVWLSSIILIVGCLTLLAQCGKSSRNLPVPGNSDFVEQLYTDNQANHKIDIYRYDKNDQVHDLFFVSTEEGQPLYAYLDGETLPTTDFQKTLEVIKKSKTFTSDQLKSLRPGENEVRTLRSHTLNIELDSIHKLITHAKADPAMKTSLLAESKSRTDEIKSLAMENYHDDTKNIAVDMKLSGLLKTIVTEKRFTQEERKVLQDLLASRN